jgi:DivIVA domain-containing protein
METKTRTPSFTVSLRGYDREEVDDYLDSLTEALGQVDDAEEHARRLQAHVTRCNARIKELEDRIRADTPKSGVALGERIGALLHEAEEAAAEAVARARTDAAQIVAAAEARAAEAEEMMRSVTSRAEEQARRIETVARGEAAEIVAEAEARAAARTRQIEQWAEQVVSHTRAEEARLFLEQQTARDAAIAELRALADQRAAAASTLIELREAIGHAVGLAGTEPDTTEPDTTEPDTTEPVGALVSEVTSPSSDQGGGTSDVLASPEAERPSYPTATSSVAGMPTDEQFEAKLDAWVSGGNGTYP